MNSQVILITGASAGIGEELARQLARERGAGVRLALAARRADRMESLARELQEKFGTETLVRATDVTHPGQIERLIGAVEERWGRLDVLVNNAGILKMEPILRMPEEDMTSMMDVNFWGPLRLVRAAVPLMARSGGGHVLQIASGVGRRGLPFMSVYCATKFALAGLTEGLRLELLAQKIHFTTVYPGGVDTDMPRNVDPAKLPPAYHRHEGMRISVDRAAKAVRKAIRRRPLEVYVPGWVRLGAWVSVLFPALGDFLIRRNYRSTL